MAESDALFGFMTNMMSQWGDKSNENGMLKERVRVLEMKVTGLMDLLRQAKAVIDNQNRQILELGGKAQMTFNIGKVFNNGTITGDVTDGNEFEG